MVRKCAQGHELEKDKDVCSHGHAPESEGAAATAAGTVTLTPQQLQELLQGAIAGALGARPTAAPSNVKRPDRPDIDLGGNEGQWAFFFDE
jgi:hypothetical protein